MTVTQQLSLAFYREQTADFDLPVGFGHAQCMSNLKARYVQIIVSAAVLKLGSFNAERIKSQIHNHHVIIKIQAARILIEIRVLGP